MYELIQHREQALEMMVLPGMHLMESKPIIGIQNIIILVVEKAGYRRQQISCGLKLDLAQRKISESLHIDQDQMLSPVMQKIMKFWRQLQQKNSQVIVILWLFAKDSLKIIMRNRR